jgi:hypothetical protein
MKLVFLAATAIVNMAVLASPIHPSKSSYISKSSALEYRIGPSPNSTATTILQELLKVQHRTDNLTNTVINRYFHLYQGQQKELHRLAHLSTRVAVNSNQRFNVILQRFRDELRPHVSEACHTFGSCNVREAALYTLVYKHNVLADRCEQLTEAAQHVEECMEIRLRPGSLVRQDLSTSSPPYLRLLQAGDGSWNWQNVGIAIGTEVARRDIHPHRGNQVDPNEIAREIETEFNKMANVLIEVECPLDMDDEEFEACIVGQKQPLERLRDRLPDYLDWSNAEEFVPGATTATTFGNCSVPPAPTSSTSNHPNHKPVSSGTVTVTM